MQDTKHEFTIDRMISLNSPTNEFCCLGLLLIQDFSSRGKWKEWAGLA